MTEMSEATIDKIVKTNYWMKVNDPIFLKAFGEKPSDVYYDDPYGDAFALYTSGRKVPLAPQPILATLTAADLERAAELVLQGWTRGAFRRQEMNLSTGQPQMTFCALGAIFEAVRERLNKANNLNDLRSIDGWEVFRGLLYYVRSHPNERDDVTIALASWNDLGAGSAQAVADLLMSAAKRLRDQGEELG